MWTEKDDAALKIQTKYRQFRAKKALDKKKKEKQEYEELMDKLEKEVSTTHSRDNRLYTSRKSKSLDLLYYQMAFD